MVGQFRLVKASIEHRFDADGTYRNRIATPEELQVLGIHPRLVAIPRNAYVASGSWTGAYFVNQMEALISREGLPTRFRVAHVEVTAENQWEGIVMGIVDEPGGFGRLTLMGFEVAFCGSARRAARIHMGVVYVDGGRHARYQNLRLHDALICEAVDPHARAATIRLPANLNDRVPRSHGKATAGQVNAYFPRLKWARPGRGVFSYFPGGVVRHGPAAMAGYPLSATARLAAPLNISWNRMTPGARPSLRNSARVSAILRSYVLALMPLAVLTLGSATAVIIVGRAAQIKAKPLSV